MTAFDSGAFDDGAFDADVGAYTTNVEPGAGALTVAGYVPVVEQFSSSGIHPGTGSLAITGYSPTVAQNSLTVDSIPNRTFFQRDGTAANVSRAGTYSGTVPDAVEEQLYAADGVTILVAWTAWTGLSAGAGSLAGVLPAPQGGMYRSKVRTKAAGVVLATTAVSANIWAVGAIGAYIGSSSAAGIFAGAGLPTNANTGQHAAGAWTTPSTGAISILVNAYANAQGVPVAMMNYGSSGSTLAGWISNNTPWNNFVSALAQVGNKLEFLFLSLGSNDADAGAITSTASHLNNLRTLVANVRSITGQPNLPAFQSGSNRRLSLTETQANYLHLAENAFGDDLDCYHIQTIDLEVSGDNIHLVPGATGYQASAARGGYQLNNKTRRGPKALSAAFAGAVVTVTMTHRGGTDFTPISAISGNTVTDGSGAPGIVSVDRASANSFAVTCDRPLVAPVTWKYLSGGWPDVSANVFDNGTTALPMVMASEVATDSAADGNAPGATLTGTSSLVAGTATGEVNASASGATLTATSSLVAGTASGTGSGTAPGATLTATSSLSAGTATGEANATAAGAVLTATASLISGSASGGENATAAGATLTAVATLIAGTASGTASATAPGATLTATAILIGGSAESITFAQAPAGSGYAPQRVQNTVRPAAIQRNKR